MLTHLASLRSRSRGYKEAVCTVQRVIHADEKIQMGKKLGLGQLVCAAARKETVDYSKHSCEWKENWIVARNIKSMDR